MSGCIALVVAAGRGSRFGGERPKQYQRLNGRPVLRHSLETLCNHPQVDAVRVIIHPADRTLYDEAAAGLDLLAPVDGGAERQDSVRLGLESLEEAAPGVVLIHDAARPFADARLISRVIEAVGKHAGAIPAVPVTDTLKRGSEGLVAGTVERTGLWRAQTPQGFRFSDILAAHRRFAGVGLTDDAAVAEHAGLTVSLVDGSEDNVKVTTPSDFRRAETHGGGEFRSGSGFDVHRFTEGDQVMLCGVAVAHEAGLAGHSDADVGLHALTDALLGAIGDGDIGGHFPPTDPQWRGAASEIFLAHAGRLVAGRGGRIINVDVTLICEAPRVGPHRQAMRERIAAILGIEVGRVGVKGTTTEKLGFTGRREGIAAQAAATVWLPSIP
ncbi:MAG: bifunctional 2-C-methyl-D-erythritol 4-phosphate cytidylyltransferase/2-C-methyl-D-erythritol 2,4-cyclodiphosphate synthase [Rhodospirillales bacterium]|nr:bifunctional 2-C-methyl-D-erythritol 4-phosphate cytidylyltransferase/2-C-methyl-D-erythritol 2,4-cyclodiphosphate synthase [Rhodospirillales bacterium]